MRYGIFINGWLKYLFKDADRARAVWMMEHFADAELVDFWEQLRFPEPHSNGIRAGNGRAGHGEGKAGLNT